MERDYYKKISIGIDSLLIYRNIIKDDIIQDLKGICELMSSQQMVDMSKLRTIYFDMCSRLIIKAEHHNFSDNILRDYIMYLFFYDENLYTLQCEKCNTKIRTSIYNSVLNDVKIMTQLMDFDMTEVSELFGNVFDMRYYRPMSKRTRKYEQLFLNSSDLEEKAAAMGNHYSQYGCGQIAEYTMFRWDNEKGMTGISNIDTITFEDLIGYEAQRKELIENTEAFLNGYPANNVLLVGARGTGKSSSVKALANEYFEKGLRLLEISKEQIIQFPNILKYIAKRGKKFIIFLDDLSFDNFEIEYKYMKSLLEGSTEKKPDNVLFYATSNRRHIIQETWSDRGGNPNDDVHAADSLNEKISLSDRFGLTLTYDKPTQQQYLQMVEAIAAKEGLEYNEAMQKAAIAWELSQKGRSGRTARQFINSYLYTNSSAKNN